MKILHIVIIAICLLQLSSKLHAEPTSDEKNFIVGRSLSLAYGLDAVSDICNGSTNSRDKFNTLKNLVRDRLKTDLYKVEKDVNMEFGKNVRDNLKIGLREHVSELGGCGSKNYYEWLVKTQKDWGCKIFCVNGQLSIIDPTRRRHDRTQATTSRPDRRPPGGLQEA